MKRERKAYRFWYTILTPFFRAFYWIRLLAGKYPAAPRSLFRTIQLIDPVLIAFAFEERTPSI